MKNILTVKVMVGMLAAGAVLFLIATLVILFGRPPSSSTQGSVPAAMTVIAAPTSTPLPVSTATPLAQFTHTPGPGDFAVGAFVQITGTSGDGLHLRLEPSLGSSPLFLGYDSEVYRVVGGPVDADGHTWWKLTAPYDAVRTGWAVQDYLTVIQSP